MSQTAEVVFLEDQTEHVDADALDVSDPQNPYLVVPGWVQSPSQSTDWEDYVHYACGYCTDPCINHIDSEPARFRICAPCVAKMLQDVVDRIPVSADATDAVALLDSV